MTTAIIALIVVYSKYNYNNFMKSVREKDKTEFTRDQEIKCSEMDSYKIESIDYNDAMFYETVSVTPNTPYKVTCKVKVKDVENEGNSKTGGAHISIAGTTERSVMISGTQDWQELTFLFNSKNRNEVNISFRLGGYAESSKGTAWFSDFKIEKGVANQNKNWNFACFIFPKLDVNVEINGKTEHIKLEMSNNDIENLRSDMARFQTSMKEMSQNKMTVTYDIFTVTNPITTLSYAEENGYYVSAEDVYDYIQPYVEKKEYDHIFIGIRMADVQKGSTALKNDWIGLRRYGILWTRVFQYQTSR